MKTLKSNAGLLFIIASWFLIITPFLLLFEKTEIHLFINQQNHPFADQFFKYATHLGEVIPITIALLVLLLYRLRLALATALAFFGSAVITQVLKRFLFQDHFRPAKVFEAITPLHFVDGVHQLSYFSFPSGHSTAAFALFTILGLITNSQLLKIAFGLTAVITAYSRMYLSQHFLEDVYVGSLIGCLCAILTYLWLAPKHWGNNGLLNLMRNKS